MARHGCHQEALHASMCITCCAPAVPLLCPVGDSLSDGDVVDGGLDKGTL